MKFYFKAEERFLLAVIAILVVFGFGLYHTMRSNIKEILISSKAQELERIIHKQATLDLDNLAFNNINQTETNIIFSEFYKKVKIDNITRIEVYDTAGEIIYSSQNEFLGKKPDNHSIHQAMKGNMIYRMTPGSETSQKIVIENNLEIFEPILINDKLSGVISLNYDLRSDLKKIDTYKNYGLALILFTFLCLFICVYWIFEYTSKKIIDSHHEQIEAAERISKLKDEFVFMAAHELRAPATVIKGYVDMLDSVIKKDDKRAKEFTKKIFESNERLILMVNDLLEIARTESGRSSIEVKPVNIIPIITNEIERYAQLAKGQKIKVEYLPNEHIPEVIANEDKLREVISNLLTNAIKYGKEGGNIIISHEMRNGAVLTHVADDGIGISEEDQLSLFQKFFRTDSASQKASGTGLGLFITKELVDRMNGEIWVTSQPGLGSTFSFKLRPSI